MTMPINGRSNFTKSMVLWCVLRQLSGLSTIRLSFQAPAPLALEPMIPKMNRIPFSTTTAPNHHSPPITTRASDNGPISPSPTRAKRPTRGAHLFEPIISSVVAGLKNRHARPKDRRLHELLSRHPKEQAPASFAITMAHTLYQLAHPLHRHYLNRLAREICAGDEDEMAEINLRNAVVKESLRMQQGPNHHSIQFTVGRSGCKVGDYWLESGIEVTASLYCISRNAAVFECPNGFNPGRWLITTEVKTNGHDEQTQKMVEALGFVLEYHRGIKPEFDTTLSGLKVLLATMLRSFDMKLPLGEQPKQLDRVAIRNRGCRVRFRERKQSVEKKVHFAEQVLM